MNNNLRPATANILYKLQSQPLSNSDMSDVYEGVAREWIRRIFFNEWVGVPEETVKKSAEKILELLEQHPRLVLKPFAIPETEEVAASRSISHQRPRSSYTALTLFLWKNLDASVLDRIFAVYTPKKGDWRLLEGLQTSLLMVGARDHFVSDETIFYVIGKCKEFGKDSISIVEYFEQAMLRSKYLSGSFLSLDFFKALLTHHPTYLEFMYCHCELLDRLIILGYDQCVLDLIIGRIPPSSKPLSLHLAPNNVQSRGPSNYDNILRFILWPKPQNVRFNKAVGRVVQAMLSRPQLLKKLDCHLRLWTKEGWDCLMHALTHKSCTLKSLSLYIPSCWLMVHHPEGHNALQHLFHQWKQPRLNYISLKFQRGLVDEISDAISDIAAFDQANRICIQSILKGLQSREPDHRDTVGRPHFPRTGDLSLQYCRGLDLGLTELLIQYLGSFWLSDCFIDKQRPSHHTLEDEAPSCHMIEERKAICRIISCIPDHSNSFIDIENYVHYGVPISNNKPLTSLSITYVVRERTRTSCVDMTDALVQFLGLSTLASLSIEVDNPESEAECTHSFDAVRVCCALKENSTLEKLELSELRVDCEDIHGVPTLLWDSVQGNSSLKILYVVGRSLAFTVVGRSLAFTLLEAPDPFNQSRRRSGDGFYVDFISANKIQHQCWLNCFGRQMLQDQSTTRQGLVEILLFAKQTRSRANNKELQTLLNDLPASSEDIGATFATIYGYGPAHFDFAWLEGPTSQYQADTLGIVYGLLRESPGIWCCSQEEATNKKRKLACIIAPQLYCR